MTTFITQFELPAGVPVDEIRKAFIEVASYFQEVQGLFSKTFLLSEDGKRGGGVYVWKSRAEAAAFEPSLRAMVREKMGVEADITYFHTPVLVDNVQRQVKTAV